MQRYIVGQMAATGIAEVADNKLFFTFNVDGFPTTDDAIRSTHKTLLIVACIGYGLNIVQHAFAKKPGQKKRKFNLKSLFRPANIIKIVIVILIGVFYAKAASPVLKKAEILELGYSSYDLNGQTVAESKLILTFACFLHALTMIRSFVFSNTITLFLAIFSTSYKDFLAFLLLFFSIFAGFSFIWWIAFSPYHADLIGYTEAAFQIFQFFASGNRYIVNQLLSLNENWAILLIVITCFIVFIQLDAIMMSIIQENVRYLYLVNENQNKKAPSIQEEFKELLLKVNHYKTKFINAIKCKGKKKKGGAKKK